MSKYKELKSLILVLILTLFIVTGIKILTGTFQERFNDSDMILLHTFRNKLQDPELYVNDKYFNQIYYPNYVNYFTRFVTSAFGEDRGLLLLNYSLFFVFFVGNYFLAKHVFKKSNTALIFAFISSFGIRALYGAYWGVIIGKLLTRDFVTAIAPLLILFFLKNINKPKNLMLLFFVFGVITNLHLISAFSLAFICGLTLLIHNLRITLDHIFMGVAYLIGSLPIVITGFNLTKITVPLEILHFRIGYQFVIPILTFAILFLPPFVVSAYGYITKKTIKKDRTILMMFLSSLGFYIGSLVLNLLIPSTSSLQLVRSIKFLFPFMYLYVAYAITHLFSKSILYKLIAIGLTLVMFLPLTYVYSAVNPKLDYTTSFDFRTELDPELLKLMESTKAISSNTMYELQEHIKHTDKDTVFLVNPFIGSSFRLDTNRATVVSFKDGGNLVITKHPEVINWYEDLKAISSVYVDPTTEQFSNIINKYSPDYVLTEQELPYELIFSNSEINLYRTQSI